MAEPMQYQQYGSDEDKFKVYEHRMSQAKRVFEDWKTAADQALDRYENHHTREQATPNGHVINEPTGIGIIDALYSSLTATEIDFVVNAIGQGTPDQAYLATAAMSKEWKLTKAQRRSNKAIKDALLVGIGWAKVGYEFYESEQELPRTDADIANDIQGMLDEAGDPEAPGYSGPSYSDIAGSVPVTEVQKVTLSDRIVVDYVPWDLIRWDPTAKAIEDITWHAQITYLHPDEVKSNPVWREYCKGTRGGLKKLDELKADTNIDRSIIGDHATVLEDDMRCSVIEMNDYRTGTVCTYVANSGFLLNEVPGVFALNDDLEDKTPFVPIVLRVSPRRVRGISEMEVVGGTLDEEDLYHAKLATYLERMSPKLVSTAGLFTDAGKEALKSQEYGAIAEIEQGRSMDEFEPFSPPQLMSEMYGMPEKLEQKARDATGVSELMRGLFPDRKRTATETTEVVSASAARQAEKRSQLEHFYGEIGQRILQLMQMFYDTERMVRFVDEAGDVQWSWSADDIVMESGLDVVLTPKEAKTWQTRRDDATATLNVLGPLAVPAADGTNPVHVDGMLDYVLTEMGIPKTVIAKIIVLPEEKQQQIMSHLQQTQQAAQAEQGVAPSPAAVPGPLDAQALAAATNQGEIDPNVLASAVTGGPLAPQSAETVSESRGVQ